RPPNDRLDGRIIRFSKNQRLHPPKTNAPNQSGRLFLDRRNAFSHTLLAPVFLCQQFGQVKNCATSCTILGQLSSIAGQADTRLQYLGFILAAEQGKQTHTG
ncbi:MAG: hypothetical protein Q8R10_18950, partial [Pseudomonas sp.]|uniref:hypothetical protein n=1 Tax=Pseudomonas sp. TaxID=306 RepID=UPI0027360062